LSSTQQTHILIYGTGAVGLGIASALLNTNSVVLTLIARPKTASALKAGGLFRTGIFGDFSASPSSFSVFSCLGEIPSDSKYGLILVCTKSFDSAFAAQDLHKHKYILKDTSAIVLFQNGWGNAEVFAEYFPQKMIYNARVITGFTRTAPNTVTITVHADSIRIGSLFIDDLTAVKPLVKLIDAGGIPCAVTSSVEKDLWAKMLYNCALNPLGAVLGVEYGKLAEQPETRLIMDNIIKETFAVISAAGFSTHWETPNDFIEIFYSKLVPDTAAHKSSTLQDILAGKKTEIDALTGQVIFLAEKHKIDVPFTTAVHNMVKFLEHKNTTAS